MLRSLVRPAVLAAGRRNFASHQLRMASNSLKIATNAHRIAGVTNTVNSAMMA